MGGVKKKEKKWKFSGVEEILFQIVQSQSSMEGLIRRGVIFCILQIWVFCGLVTSFTHFLFLQDKEKQDNLFLTRPRLIKNSRLGDLHEN